jgi:septal ring factor EnvC (AmiA/AmiB activator)
LEQKKKIEKEIEFTNKLLEETRSKRDNSLNELKLLNSNIKKRNQLISRLNSELSKIEKQINKNISTINSLKTDLEKSKKEYARLIYFAFKNSNTDLNFMYLLAAKDLNQFYARFKYLQQYKDYRLKQMNLIIALSKVIEDRIRILTVQKNDKISIINSILTERSNLLSESETTNKVVKILKQKEKELAKELDDKKEIIRKLDKEIEDIITREAKKKSYKNLSSEDNIISSDFAKNQGKLPWPTKQGVITSKFGEHPHPVLKDVTIRNNGIDISTLPNSPVRVIFAGEITKVFSIKGANSTIIVQHGKFFTVYHNIVAVKVKAGDKVAMKDTLGEVFTDPKNGESTLHFEIWKELIKQNPEVWLSN